ncbi:DNA cytosine methyltransferase [Methanococcoides burtonii]|uniref:DNA (cytosine-5-)-methyltransferase n=1 Tax=Methanococcoides burtonii (strain DSM 6242 / NBRC 107633 / OCM 468 / ACE-M) TaxID=259564 RepID=Q12VT1_METBU|nr:DNA cytosine methyltransferase [Methanococcoides burtonii]ABE52445.1 DNA-cytosine methyltransferase [Methanococcoides burtonii DSM 6242]
MVKRFTVADFFCGAGGSSEGFRQAGFEIVFALDIWNPARETHKLNHPNCAHFGLDCYKDKDGDILKIETTDIDDVIPDVDVIVGSPPCVSFSSSNRAGKADKTHGIRLIKKYLQIISIKKHKPGSILKYWLLENVPNTMKQLQEEYTFRELELTNEILLSLGIQKRETDIALKIDISDENIYNAADYGIPQRRKRLVIGDYPRPDPTHKDKWISLSEVINAFDYDITDPNFGFSIDTEELTDHFYDTSIHEYDWLQARDRKQQARYYGRMAFPEETSVPSRTVMAMRTTSSREAMIFEGNNPGSYRAPTIREIATLMSFPITYLFQGKSEGIKYKLVGNAVCPKLAYAFAEEILKKEMIEVKQDFDPNSDKNKLEFDLTGWDSRKIPQNKHEKANFTEIVPNMKYKNFRVELDNSRPRYTDDSIVWSASIHHGTGKSNMKVARPSKENVLTMLYQFEDGDKIDSFIKANEEVFDKKIPCAEVFQSQYRLVEPNKDIFTPRDALGNAKILVDRFFPRNEYEDMSLSNMSNEKDGRIIKFSPRDILYKNIPIRIVAALYSVIHITELTVRL